MRMTFNQYDKMVAKFDKMETVPRIPTYEQIEKFREDPDKWIKYCCYILEKDPEPQTTEEKYAKSNLNAFVNENLELYD